MLSNKLVDMPLNRLRKYKFLRLLECFDRCYEVFPIMFNVGSSKDKQ